MEAPSIHTHTHVHVHVHVHMHIYRSSSAARSRDRMRRSVDEAPPMTASAAPRRPREGEAERGACVGWCGVSWLSVGLPSHHRHITVALPLRCRYIAVTLPLHYRYIAVTGGAPLAAWQSGEAGRTRSLPRCGERISEEGQGGPQAGGLSTGSLRAMPCHALPRAWQRNTKHGPSETWP